MKPPAAAWFMDVPYTPLFEGESYVREGNVIHLQRSGDQFANCEECSLVVIARAAGNGQFFACIEIDGCRQYLPIYAEDSITVIAESFALYCERYFELYAAAGIMREQADSPLSLNLIARLAQLTITTGAMPIAIQNLAAELREYLRSLVRQYQTLEFMYSNLAHDWSDYPDCDSQLTH